eukprot:NODE_16503_length_991_cov_3.115741.p1 GENE.NODE_16503_length_991_cov_3.115741~~NODE_16503_length_991_cov_3.115741.p1  ORF type:complete len:253 (+),score=84.16 NODE_16503_length_991_cov_3.115741:85-759(+)
MESLMAWDAAQSPADAAPTAWQKPQQQEEPRAAQQQQQPQRPPPQRQQAEPEPQQQPQAKVQPKPKWGSKPPGPQGTCTPWINVSQQHGGGIDLTPTRWGMRVDSVGPTPGQPHLKQGDTIVSIGGVSLENLPNAQATGDAFGRGFADGAAIVTLQRVDDAIQLPPQHTNWGDTFPRDIETLGSRFGIMCRLQSGQVEMRGPANGIAEAMIEIKKMIAFYSKGG